MKISVCWALLIFAPIVAKTRVKAIALAAVEEIAQVHPISKGHLLSALNVDNQQFKS